MEKEDFKQILSKTREKRFQPRKQIVVHWDEEIPGLTDVILTHKLLTMVNFHKAREFGFRITDDGDKEKSEDLIKVCVVCQAYEELGWGNKELLENEPAGIISQLYEKACMYSGFQTGIIKDFMEEKKNS